MSEIEEIILAYANGDFSKRLKIDNLSKDSVIATGINMLGEELKEKTISRDYFSKIFDSIPEIIIAFNKTGEIDIMNENAKKYFKRKDKTHQISIFEMISFNINDNIKDFINSNQENSNFEVSINNTSKDLKYLSCNLMKIDQVKANHYLFLAKDITNEKNEETKILKATLIGQEIERKRLAYDLHDSLGQELNAIKMYMNVMECVDINSKEFEKSRLKIHEILDGSVSSIRNMCFDLIPSKFDQKDFHISITQLINKFNTLKKIQIKANIPEKSIQLKEKNDELFLYRIIEEFLNNSLQHSKASTIFFKIKIHDNLKKIEVDLEDDGNGFEIKKISKRNGINNMMHRLKCINARYTYTSELLKGTNLKFEIYK